MLNDGKKVLSTDNLEPIALSGTITSHEQISSPSLTSEQHSPHLHSFLMLIKSRLGSEICSSDEKEEYGLFQYISRTSSLAFEGT